MLGALVKYTRDDNSAFLASLELGAMDGEPAVMLRGGYKFKSPLYVTASFHTGGTFILPDEKIVVSLHTETNTPFTL